MRKIAFHKSRGDLRVCSLDGIQTCSFVDPRKEAAQWVDHYRGQIERSHALVVLGLGSGFHIESLLENFDGPIFVLEKHKDFISEFRTTTVSENKKCNRVHISLLEDFDGNFIPKEYFKDLSVLVFAPTAYLDLEDYKPFFDLFQGRSKESVERQFSLRGVDHFFLPETFKPESPGKEYQRLAKEQALTMRWQQVFKMIGELIK